MPPAPTGCRRGGAAAHNARNVGGEGSIPSDGSSKSLGCSGNMRRCHRRVAGSNPASDSTMRVGSGEPVGLISRRDEFDSHTRNQCRGVSQWQSVLGSCRAIPSRNFRARSPRWQRRPAQNG